MYSISEHYELIKDALANQMHYLTQYSERELVISTIIPQSIGFLLIIHYKL